MNFCACVLCVYVCMAARGMMAATRARKHLYGCLPHGRARAFLSGEISPQASELMNIYELLSVRGCGDEELSAGGAASGRISLI